ncbi:MAG: hypothetical protein ABFS17_00010 [Chloroflexota bacterium]
MNMEFLFLIGGFIFIALIWKRLFNLGGKIFLGIFLLLFMLSTMRSIYYGLSLLFILAIFAVYFLIYYKNKSVKYLPAVATFETSEILRGLTPVEAAYFLQLSINEIFIIALLDLLDKEIVLFSSIPPKSYIQLADDYRVTNNIISPDNKREYRNNAARRNKKIIHQYDDIILEMISSRNQMSISDFDVDLWYRIFIQSMEKLEGVYQPVLTKAYAAKIANKYTSSHSAFNKGKVNISGWYAASILIGETEGEINHRPAWLAPDDGFSSFVLTILDAL